MTKIVSPEWQDYLNKMRELEAQVKLVSYHTQECARATRECAYYTQVVVDETRKEIEKQGQFAFSFVRNIEGGK